MTNAALMTLASVLLGAFILLIVWINKREAVTATGAARPADEKLGKEGGFSLVLKNRYLLLIAFYVLILNLVNTVGGYVLDCLFVERANEAVATGEIAVGEEGSFIRTMAGELFGWVNLLGLLIQSLLVRRFIKYFGIRGSLFIGPVVSLVTYGTTALRPVLNVVWNMKIAENSNDYSTNNTVRQALFLPMSRDAKYKAKAAIDTFFGRFGDALHALVVFIGTRLSFAIPAFALINVAFVGIWLAVCGGIVKEHKKLSTEG